MIRKINFFILFFHLSCYVGAQFSSSEIEKSVVRVEVTVPSEKNAFVCTGFVWKTTDQVVTSLHAMRLGGKIWVKYLQDKPREMEIIKVLMEADLVLLKVKPGQAEIPSGVEPFTNFNGQIIQEHAVIYALGYNRGAPAPSTQDMKKGYTKSETLETFIPKKDKDALLRSKMPSITLDIIYCNGSLQPGYSGAPAYDAQGKLVGIGDGGLEEGQINVSWIIPAKYLSNLEKSEISSLPSDFDEISQHFSARVELPVSEELSNLTQTSSNEISNISPEETVESEEGTNEEYTNEYVSLEYEEYTPVKSTEFEFWLTKNRSIEEMSETADDPEKLFSIIDFIEDFNVELSYDDLRFDIMEDPNNGVILAVPEGEELNYDEDNEIFQVNYDNNPYVDLFYTGWTVDNSETNFDTLISDVIDFVIPDIQETWSVKNFSLYTTSYWAPIDDDDNRKIARILLKSEDIDVDGNKGTVYTSITLLMSYDKSFMGVASFWMSEKMLDFAKINGVNCKSSYSDECEYFETLIKVFCASHLTMFAY